MKAYQQQYVREPGTLYIKVNTNTVLTFPYIRSDTQNDNKTISRAFGALSHS